MRAVSPGTPGEARPITSHELLSLALRYKRPDREESQPLNVIVRDQSARAPSRNLGFAAAVDEFGLLLRDSPHKGLASYAQAAELGRRHRGDDPEGYRGQFVRLVELAVDLSRTRAARQQ